MLKQLSKLEIQIGEKIYQLLCDSDSPLEHVKEAVFQFGKYVGQVEDAVKMQKSKVAAENPNPDIQPPIEEPKEE